jgi:hypothetical protein
MKESNAKYRNLGISTFQASTQRIGIDDYALYVGLDVHRDTIAIAVANPGRGKADYRG